MGRTIQNSVGLTCYPSLSAGDEYLFFGHRAEDGEIEVGGWPATSDGGPQVVAAIEQAIGGAEHKER